jgi:hypothetical protein
MSDETTNPLTAMVTFPDAVVLSQQEVLPSESIGWGLNLVLSLPPRIAYEYVRSQLETAGFSDESPHTSLALFRLIRDDAYVWGRVSPMSDGGSHVFLSTSPQQENIEDSQGY